MLMKITASTCAVLLLAGCTNLASGPEETTPEPPKVTASAAESEELTPAGLSIEDGCKAVGAKLKRVGTLMDLAIDALTDGESVAFIAPDYREAGEEIIAISTQVEDPDFADTIKRWGEAQIQFSEELAVDADSFDSLTEMKLATAELEGACPNL